MQYAPTPNLDRLARKGTLGTVKTIPAGFSPGSDVANLSVLGYDPREHYAGRAPLEAASMGVPLERGDLVFRCSLVTLTGEKEYAQKIMVDHSADEITTAEAKELIKEVQARLGNEIYAFYPGVSYRHLMVWRGEEKDFVTTPPHEILGEAIAAYLPQGEKRRALLNLMEKSSLFLPLHPVNKERIKKGLRPANSIWFWGQGRKSVFPSFQEKYGLTGAVISAVDLVKGLGKYTGLEVVEVPGATGNIKTNFRGKARAALERLKKGKDFVYLHVEAPDEASHRGERETKIKAIAEIDEKIVGEVWQGLTEFGEFRILVLPDHFTPLARRTHAVEAVPFLIYDSRKPQSTNVDGYHERAAASSDLYFEQGHELMPFFLRKQ